MSRFFISFILIVQTLPGLGQIPQRPGEFGKPTKDWWTNEKFNASDTSFSAMILFDYGKCTPEPYAGTKLVRQRRMKIFKNNNLSEWLDLSFDSKFIRLTDFSATVYNLEDGKIVETVIDESAIMESKVKGIRSSSVAIPDVRAGSVVEYAYTIKSDYFAILAWDFQYSIPVVWSEYDVFVSGARGVSISINGLLKLTSSKIKGGWRNYVMTDIPPFVPEVAMPIEDFYRSSIHFKPASTGVSQVYRMEVINRFGLRRDSITLDTRNQSEVNFEILPNDEVRGNVTVHRSGFGAVVGRKEIRSIGSDSYLKKELIGENLTILKQEILNEMDSTKELILNYELLIQNHVQRNDSMMYVSPSLVFQSELNIFKSKSRKYPIDLVSRKNDIIITRLTIPTGYVINALPKSIIMELPSKFASFSANASVLNNTIYITNVFKTNRILFDVSQYAGLKEFFERMVSKKSEPIVLKKRKY